MLGDSIILGSTLANPSLMHGPAYYSIIWVLIGILFILGIAGILFFIFFSTRKKEIKTIANLKAEAPRIPDLTELRKKYISMVNETEQRFSAHKIRASMAHQELSIAVRKFYAEASGFHAEVMTLSDLKRSKKVNLTQVINIYYPDEFNQLEKGPVAQSAELARKLIMNDEVLNRPQNTATTADAPTAPTPTNGGTK